MVYWTDTSDLYQLYTVVTFNAVVIRFEPDQNWIATSQACSLSCEEHLTALTQSHLPPPEMILHPDNCPLSSTTCPSFIVYFERAS